MFNQLILVSAIGILGFTCSYVLFTIARNYIVYRKFRKLSPKMPIAPNGSLLGGHNLLWTKMGNVKLIHEYHQKLGKTFAFFINHRPLVVTIDEDLIKRYGFDEKNIHTARPVILSPIIQFMSDSIVIAHGELLARLRPIVANALANNKLKSPLVSEQMKTSVNKLVDSFEWRLKHHSEKRENGQVGVEINLNDLISRYTVDLVFSTMQKQTDLVDFKSKSDKLVEGSIRAVTICTEWFMVFYTTFPLLNRFGYELSKFAEPILHSFVNKHYRSALEVADLNYEARKQFQEERKKAIDDNDQLEFNKVSEIVTRDGKVFKRGLMDYVIDKLYDRTISIKEYINSSFFIHTAAERTTSDHIVHLIVNLAIYQEHQEKLRKSIIIDGVSSQYLNWFIFETLRLLPPVPIGVVRVLEHDITTKDGLFIPKSTSLTTISYSLHRSKELWGEDAEEFKPERWANEKDFLPHQFVGFGAGKRYCLGKNYALATTKLLVVALLSKFKFEPSPQTDYHHIQFGSPFFLFLVPEKSYYIMLKYIEK